MKENVNIPAAGIEPRGEVTIEIFDETSGELVERKKKTNFVSDRLLKAYQLLAIRGALVGGSPNNYRLGSVDRLFDTVALSDFAGSPSPETENYLQGNIIGFGAVDQAADTEKRGAYNAIESVFTPTYLKVVFDFATSQGNGTFQSIYTFEGSGGGISYQQPPFLGSFRIPFSFTHMFAGADSLFFIKAGFLYQLKNPVFKSNRLGDFVADYTTIALPTTTYIYGAAARGDEIFIAARNRNNNYQNIEKMSLSNPDVFTVAKTLPFSARGGIAYNAKLDRFYVGEYNTERVHVFDSSWNEVEVISKGVPDAVNDVLMGGKYLSCSNYLIDLETKNVYFSILSNHYALTELGSLFSVRQNYIQNEIVLTPQALIFSRALLDAPVTKTAQQNMKITYEFNIPPVNLLEL